MTTTDPERDYRDALASVRALVAGDTLAAAVIARYADPRRLLVDVAAVSIYLLTANVDQPLKVIDQLFADVEQTLADAAARRHSSDETGSDDD